MPFPSSVADATDTLRADRDESPAIAARASVTAVSTLSPTVPPLTDIPEDSSSPWSNRTVTRTEQHQRLNTLVSAQVPARGPLATVALTTSAAADEGMEGGDDDEDEEAGSVQ